METSGTANFSPPFLDNGIIDNIVIISWNKLPVKPRTGSCRNLILISYTFTSGFFSPNFSFSISQISLRGFPCFSICLILL